MYDPYEAELFFRGLQAYVDETTVLTTYMVMPEESRRKHRERIVITTCKTYAPKRNGISMQMVRSFVGEVLTVMEDREKGRVLDDIKDE